ncbi:radical SAM protein [Candidatus Pacearchaeota archaeon]|nr:radical SAM protein [Candidatus Pacearchaeota archaeon]
MPKKILVVNLGSKKGETVSKDVLYGAWCRGRKVGLMEYPPLPLLYINTLLNKNGFETVFLDAQGEKISHSQLFKKFDWKKIDYIITQTATMTFNDDIELMSEIKKKNPQLKIIVFGSHVTFLPQKSLENNVIDFVVRREPEFPILNLIKVLNSKKDFSRIKGIAFKKGKKYIINPFDEHMDLSQLPYPDREPIFHINYYNPLVKYKNWTTVETTRGCPSKCTFCTAPYFFGIKIRRRSNDSILEELKYLKKRGYQEVWFRDEIFTFDRERVREICTRMINDKLKLKWICNGKIGMLDKETMMLMKKAGCRVILFGVESGDQKILNNIKKGITLEKVRETFKWAKEAKIETHAHFMIGNPGDNRETVEKTIKFAKEIDPDTVAFGILTVYPGTELFDTLKGKLKDYDGTQANIEVLHIKSFNNEMFTDLSAAEIEEYLIKAYQSFYMRPRYIIKQFFGIRSVKEAYSLFKSGIAVFLLVLQGKN